MSPPRRASTRRWRRERACSPCHRSAGDPTAHAFELAGTEAVLCTPCHPARPTKASVHAPFAIAWAVSIHTVTAFLYVGLGGRPFWNSAIIAPRFLASAFAAGPAFLILTLQVIRGASRYQVPDEALRLLRNIVTVALAINTFLLGCELFTEFYTDSAHIASA
jgi:predicted CXXCH cytochrome family protein